MLARLVSSSESSALTPPPVAAVRRTVQTGEERLQSAPTTARRHPAALEASTRLRPAFALDDRDLVGVGRGGCGHDRTAEHARRLSDVDESGRAKREMASVSMRRSMASSSSRSTKAAIGRIKSFDDVGHHIDLVANRATQASRCRASWSTGAPGGARDLVRETTRSARSPQRGTRGCALPPPEHLPRPVRAVQHPCACEDATCDPPPEGDRRR